MSKSWLDFYPSTGTNAANRLIFLNFLEDIRSSEIVVTVHCSPRAPKKDTRQGNTLDKIDKRARLFRRSAENRLPSCPIGGEVKEPTEHLTTAELLAVLRERLPEWPPIKNDESKIRAASGLHCKS